MNFQDVIMVLAICVAHSSPVDAHFTCVGTCYKGHFIEGSHVTSNKALVGHSFLNFTVYAPHQCLSACLARCRCMAFQLEETRCELLDQDRSFSPEDFHVVQGYKYFDVEQALNRNEDAGSCINGCCKTSPCLNGGTCYEHCDKITVKFSCSCVAGFTGKVCEAQSSCATHNALDNSAQNGVYEISDGSQVFNVYCDFTSEPNFIWTLVESFELNKRGAFRYDFLTDIPIQADDPQFSEHRLPVSARTHLLIDATHIRATCEFDKGFSYTDYLRGKLTEILLVRQGGRCTLFERINIRGNECTDCKARYFGKSGEHNHIASAEGQECSCNNCVPWTGSVGSEDSFGLFAARNPDHRCSRNDQATTQWWLGVQVSP